MVTETDHECQQNYRPKHYLNTNPGFQQPGMVVKMSQRWALHRTTGTRKFHIYHHAESGKLSTHLLCTWVTTPEAYIATRIATCYQRLQAFIRKRKRGISYRLREACFKVAVLYSLTNSNRVVDFFLGASRKRAKRTLTKIHGFLHANACRLDENNRFVYGLAYFNRLWLMRRTSVRDKSRIIDETRRSHVINVMTRGNPALFPKWLINHPRAFDSINDRIGRQGQVDRRFSKAPEGFERKSRNFKVLSRGGAKAQTRKHTRARRN